MRERLGKRGIGNVELKFGTSGQFDVFVDEKRVFSKADTGRFPTDGEIDSLI